jgi:hypothetical protein
MNIYFSTFLEYVFLGATATPSDSQAFSPCISSARHRLVLELSRAHKEGKAATIGDPSRVGERG